jgi:hypothetical protein
MTAYRGPGGHSFFIEFFKRVTDLAYGPYLKARLRSQRALPFVLSTDAKCSTCNHVLYRCGSWDRCVYCFKLPVHASSEPVVEFFELFAKYLLAMRLPYMAGELQGMFIYLNNFRDNGCWGCQTHHWCERQRTYCNHRDEYTHTKKRVVQCDARWCKRSDGVECCWCKQLCCSDAINVCWKCAKPCCLRCFDKYGCDQCQDLFLCAYCAPARKAYYSSQEKPVLWCQPCIDADTILKCQAAKRIKID